MTPLIDPHATVLFQGDSITDAGRGAMDPESLGTGYAMMAASWAPDGVHPTPAGHALIAQSWLRAVKAMD